MKITFHHVGVACQNLEVETERFSLLGYEPEGSDFTDFTQGVKGRFICGAGPRLELLQGLPGEGILTPWLKSGVKLYHLAYETPDLPMAVKNYQLQGAKLVVAPVPAGAFSGRSIAFLMLPNMLLIELIES